MIKFEILWGIKIEVTNKTKDLNVMEWGLNWWQGGGIGGMTLKKINAMNQISLGKKVVGPYAVVLTKDNRVVFTELRMLCFNFITERVSQCDTLICPLLLPF